MAKIKKIISAALTTAMCLSCNTVVFATQTNVTANKEMTNISLESDENANLSAYTGSLSEEIKSLPSINSNGISEYSVATYDAEGDNTDAGTTNNHIYNISENMTYTDTMGAVNEPHFYVINSAKLSKLTAVALFKEDADFSMGIFKQNSDGKLELVTSSAQNVLSSKDDSLAVVPDGSQYVIEVVTSKGTGDFNLRVEASSACSVNEPNDNVFQANEYTDRMNVTDSLDNTFDRDISKFTVTKDSEYVISTSVTGDATLNNVQIINFDKGTVSEATGATNKMVLAKGTYYILVTGNMTTINNSYNLKILPSSSVAASVNVTANGQWTNQGYGAKYYIGGDTLKFTGTAYNADGQVAPYALIAVGTTTPLANKTFTGYATTDADGKFTVELKVDPAVGQYTCNGSMTTHYFDILQIVFMNSSANEVKSNVTSVYHQAYCA